MDPATDLEDIEACRLPTIPEKPDSKKPWGFKIRTTQLVGDGYTVFDRLVTDGNPDSVVDTVSQNLLLEEIMSLLRKWAKAGDIGAKVVILYLGLEDGAPMSFRKIAQVLKCCPDTAARRYEDCIKRIREELTQVKTKS